MCICSVCVSVVVFSCHSSFISWFSLPALLVCWLAALLLLCAVRVCFGSSYVETHLFTPCQTVFFASHHVSERGSGSGEVNKMTFAVRMPGTRAFRLKLSWLTSPWGGVTWALWSGRPSLRRSIVYTCCGLPSSLAPTFPLSCTVDTLLDVLRVRGLCRPHS